MNPSTTCWHDCFELNVGWCTTVGTVSLSSALLMKVILVYTVYLDFVLQVMKPKINGAQCNSW